MRYHDDIQDDYWYQTLVSLVEEGQTENERFSDVLQESRSNQIMLKKNKTEFLILIE